MQATGSEKGGTLEAPTEKASGDRKPGSVTLWSHGGPACLASRAVALALSKERSTPHPHLCGHPPSPPRPVLSGYIPGYPVYPHTSS